MTLPCLRPQELIYTGTDIGTLMQEIQKAQDVINKIKDMKQGLIGTALVTVLNEVQHFSLVWCLVL